MILKAHLWMDFNFYFFKHNSHLRPSILLIYIIRAVSSALSPVDFPLGNSTLAKELCKKVEKTIKIYCHVLLNTQSQTQAVSECLHCLLQSTGSSPSDWDQYVQTDMTWCFSWWTESTWVHSPGEKSLGGPSRQLTVLLVTAIEGMRTGLPQHNTLLPQGIHSFYG